MDLAARQVDIGHVGVKKDVGRSEVASEYERSRGRQDMCIFAHRKPIELK